MDEDRYGWHDDGAEFPAWLGWVFAAVIAALTGLLLLLWVDLHHDYTRPPLPHTVVNTPHTCGPPPGMLLAVIR